MPAFNLNTYTRKYVHTENRAQEQFSPIQKCGKNRLEKIVEKIRFQLSIRGNVNLNNLLAISRFGFVIYYIIMRCYSILFKKLFCALSEKSSRKVAIMTEKIRNFHYVNTRGVENCAWQI